MTRKISALLLAMLLTLAPHTGASADVTVTEDGTIFSLSRINRNEFRVTRNNGAPVRLTIEDRALCKMTPRDIGQFVQGLDATDEFVILYNVFRADLDE